MNKENNREPRTEEAEVVNEEVNCVIREVKNAIRRMKKGTAVGPDELPKKVWKCMGKMGIKFLTRLFNRLLMGEQMPEEWRSVLIPIYKNTRGCTVLWKLQRNKANEPHNEGMGKNY